MRDPREEEIRDLGVAVFEAAQSIFSDCQAEEDFGVQYTGSSSAVFGGHNRVCWTPRLGFYPDRPYCTERFLRLYDEKCRED